jgi:hypothetical protein
MEILVITGAVSLMAIGAFSVVMLVAFIIYKTDPTYDEFGFWGNFRMELSTIIAGKFGYEVSRQEYRQAYELGIKMGDRSLQGSKNRHPANNGGKLPYELYLYNK